MGHTNPILAISIAKTDLIVSSSSDNTIRLWDLNSGQQLYGYRYDITKYILGFTQPDSLPKLFFMMKCVIYFFAEQMMGYVLVQR